MPWRYDAPLRDMRFVIERVLEAPASWAQCAAFAELDTDTAAAVMEEGARFASGVLLPLVASRRSLPARWLGSGSPAGQNMLAIWPPTTSVMPGTLPR